MNELVSSPAERNSTNDRSSRYRPVAAGLALLARVSPSLAAEAASRLFLLVPRVPSPRGDAAAFLASGERLTVTVGERRLAAWSWGGGPAVVLAHGWGGRGAQMRAFVPALVAAGYRAVTFDAPAHGSTSGRWTSLPGFAEAIAAVVEKTDARGVVAHSMGGAATLLALSRGLALSRAAVLGAPASATRIWSDYSRGLGLSREVADAARRRLEARIGMRFADLDAEAVAPRVATPVLVLHDREDAEVPYANGEENARLLPDARLLPTRGFGHRRMLRDAGVVEAVVRWLAEGIAPASCASCGRALGTLGTGTLCGACTLGFELFEREHRSAA